MKVTIFFAALLILLAHTTFSQQFSPRYELVKMGKNVNSNAYDEMAPVISADGKKLYYFVLNHPDNTYGKENSEDIWISIVDDKGEWSQAKRLTSPLNESRYNQVFTALSDGSLFVRGGRSKNSKGFSLVSLAGGWQELHIKDYEEMRKGTFDGGTISDDGKHAILYFSELKGSNRSDLYVTNQQADGSWSKPVKISASTTSDEYGPFIGPDQKTLFFASDRIAPGRLGGTDVYKVTRLDDTWLKWSEPQNLGKAINTTGGDAYFSIDANGHVFTARSSNRVDGGNFDIFILKPKNVKITLSGMVYNEKNQQPIASIIELMVKEQSPVHLTTKENGKFETNLPEVDAYTIHASAAGFLPKDIEAKIPKLNSDTTLHVVVNLTPITKKLFLGGTVSDRKTQQPITSKLTINYKQTQESIALNADGGKYSYEIAKLGWYVLTASAEGYLTTIDSAKIDNEEVTPTIKNLTLAPIEIGATVRLKNIYFDYDKTTLKAESFLELNKVVDLLKQNPSLEIEIEGHTDSQGSDQYNTDLSQGRAQSVVDYIASQSISKNRLTAKGFGESKPIDTNDTEAGKANNRRVEFTIVKK
jgi:outer membrane protein OmpA-like peptidoglycan-associated protein